MTSISRFSEKVKEKFKGKSDLINNPEALKFALKEKAKLFRSNPHLKPSDSTATPTINNSLAKQPSKPTERD